MLCRNCNHNLSGEEDFCPHCGIPQKVTDVSVTVPDKLQESKSEPNNVNKQDNSIFQSEPVYIYPEPPKEKEAKKNKAAIAFVSLFIVTLLIIGTLTLGEYLQLTPAFSDLLQTDLSTTQPVSLEASASEEYDNFLGVIPPDISLKSTLCTVMSEKGLQLRKGPDSSYALIDTVPYDTRLQIIGKSLNSNLWGYVYVPSLDLYGWLLCSYLTEYSELKEDTTPPPEKDSQQEAPSEEVAQETAD